MAGSLRERYLVCYPGSGSKWLMRTLSVATGYDTFGVAAFKYPRDSTFLIKSHHQDPYRAKRTCSVLSRHQSKRWTRYPEELDYRLGDIRFTKGRAVLLLRSPYDAMVSFWNHDRTYSYNGGTRIKDGLKDLAPSIQTEIFRDFVKHEMRMWEEIYLDYLSVGSRLLAVHYEDMKMDMRGEVLRILEHLELLPADAERLNCSLTMPHDKIKRKARELEDPYDDELREIIEAAIGKVQEMLRFRNLKPMPLDKYRWRKNK